MRYGRIWQAQDVRLICLLLYISFTLIITVTKKIRSVFSLSAGAFSLKNDEYFFYLMSVFLRRVRVRCMVRVRVF